MRPTPAIEAQKIAEWHAVLMGAIEQLEHELDTWLGDERASLGMLTYLAVRGRATL